MAKKRKNDQPTTVPPDSIMGLPVAIENVTTVTPDRFTITNDHSIAMRMDRTPIAE